MPHLVPHLVQYQGSKRRLASQILKYLPSDCGRLIEPFAGIAAVSLAAAVKNQAQCFYLNDLNAPLIGILQSVVEDPDRLSAQYAKLWQEQFNYPEHTEHFFQVRERFNHGEQTPANLLYLLARCVKGAVRYNQDGDFNQSPDRRRHGTKPEIIASNAREISKLLKGRTTFSAVDYRVVLEQATADDIVYLDPPYQGTSGTKNQRYLSGLSYSELVSSLADLEQRKIGFLLSYDGCCGSTRYGLTLPDELRCTRILLNAGTSAQATLLGKQATTFEALYLSPHLHERLCNQSEPPLGLQI